MFTSTTKLIAALAISTGLLTTNAALAKGGPGKSGGGNSSGNHGQSTFNSAKFNSFKLNSNSNNNNNKNSNKSNSQSSSISGISKKPTTLSQTFKKQDFNFKKVDVNKDHKNSQLGISLNSLKKDDHKDDHKDMFCKKDNKCSWDWCYSKNHCYPYYFGCYSPLYSCYDYCTPVYTTCNYSCSSLTVVENVQPPRTPVAVGSVLMINGQAFGPQAGGARLSLNGMAMPIEVLEWSPVGVKIRLPQLVINGVTPADIEVIRGDGSLASTTPVDLTGSPAPLAVAR